MRLGGHVGVNLGGAQGPLCGGSSAAQGVDATCAALVAKHRGEIEARLGKTFPKFVPVEMTTQVVAGTNYQVKIDAGIEFIHVRIYSHFSGSSELSYVKGDLHAFAPLDTWNDQGATGHAGHNHGHAGHNHGQAQPEPLCGGSSAPGAIDATCAALVAKHRGEIEARLGKTFPKFVPVQMSTQVVAGINYHVKIDAGIEFIHVRIYNHFSGSSELSYVKGDLHAHAILDTWNGS